MAFTKKIKDATEYFNNQTIKGDSWSSFDEDDREKALVQAQREIELFLNADAEDPGDNSRYRWDYAIFEHALQLLEYQPRQRGSGKSKVIDPLGKSQNNDENDGSFVPVAIIAQKYLGMNRIKMVRG